MDTAELDEAVRTWHKQNAANPHGALVRNERYRSAVRRHSGGGIRRAEAEDLVFAHASDLPDRDGFADAAEQAQTALAAARVPDALRLMRAVGVLLLVGTGLFVLSAMEMALHEQAWVTFTALLTGLALLWPAMGAIERRKAAVDKHRAVLTTDEYITATSALLATGTSTDVVIDLLRRYASVKGLSEWRTVVLYILDEGARP